MQLCVLFCRDWKDEFPESFLWESPFYCRRPIEGPIFLFCEISVPSIHKIIFKKQSRAFSDNTANTAESLVISYSNLPPQAQHEKWLNHIRQATWNRVSFEWSPRLETLAIKQLGAPHVEAGTNNWSYGTKTTAKKWMGKRKKWQISDWLGQWGEHEKHQK